MKFHSPEALTAIVLVAVCSGCALAPDYKAQRCVSVESLKADVDHLKGTVVAVCGYLKYDFEDKNLYQSARAAEAFVDSQCVAIGTYEGMRIDLPSFRDSWVRVTGVVSADFCPPDTICSSSCSLIGVFVKEVERLP